MLGIAYAKRSLKGATCGSKSCNLPRSSPAALVDGTFLPKSRAALPELRLCRSLPRRSPAAWLSTLDISTLDSAWFILSPSAFSLLSPPDYR